MADNTEKRRKLVIGPDGKLPDDLVEELTQWLAETERSAVPPELPPWLAFPDLPRTSIGWRMGAGEDYLTEFRRWIRGMSTELPTVAALLHTAFADSERVITAQTEGSFQ